MVIEKIFFLPISISYSSFSTFPCFRTLSHLRRAETDEALLAHAALATEEVDKIVRELFGVGGGGRVPQKTIYVMDAPPDPFE